MAIGGTVAILGKKDKPAPEPSSAPLAASGDSASPGYVAGSSIAPQKAFGDSAVTGHGADAMALTKGKAPRPVTADAVALLQLSLSRKTLALGDTARAKLEAFDDAGAHVTTPEIVWVSSNPWAIRFLGPGQLVATGLGSSTIGVSVGSSSTKLTVEVVAKKR